MKSYSERQHYAQKSRFSAVPLVPKALFLYHGRFSPKLQDRSVKIVGKPVKYHIAKKTPCGAFFHSQDITND